MRCNQHFTKCIVSFTLHINYICNVKFPLHYVKYVLHNYCLLNETRVSLISAIGVSSFQILIAPFILELLNDDSLPHSRHCTKNHPSSFWVTMTDVMWTAPSPHNLCLVPFGWVMYISFIGTHPSNAPQVHGLMSSCSCGPILGFRLGLNPILFIFSIVLCNTTCFHRYILPYILRPSRIQTRRKIELLLRYSFFSRYF